MDGVSCQKNLKTQNLSENKKSPSWKEAWDKSPGPRTQKDFLILFIKGLAMGVADVIPGVSGGTVAFITGIYNPLLSAINAITPKTFLTLAKGNGKSALEKLHLRFLLPLAAGIGFSIITFSRLMHFLFTQYSVYTWSLFFGLILASVYLMLNKLEKAKTLHEKSSKLFFIAFGTFAAYFLVGLIPVHTPTNWWFIILSGAIGITAMILPGISGAFLLLILGKYEYITSAIKDPFHFDHLQIIGLFAIGICFGLMSFSRVLKFLLDKYQGPTIALLTGFMIGALRKIWPWKEVLESQMIRGKIYVLREINAFPSEWTSEVTGAFFLMLSGLFLVLLLARLAHKN